MLHGVLLVHKIKGGTSHDVVQSVRKILRQKQVGHAGTLDPMAEGLMVILLGYGTKLSQWLLTSDKSYHFVFRLGVQTDTLDKTGQVTQRKKVRVETNSTSQAQEHENANKSRLNPSVEEEPTIQLQKATVQSVIESAQGEIAMPVPAFSAVKIKGKKMYEYQRRGQAVEIPLRKMFFYDLTIKNIQSETVEVALSCQKGSYVRAWVSYVGDKLGTGACLESLTRLKSTPFELSHALSLKELQQRLNEEHHTVDRGALLKPAFVPFSQTLQHIPAVELFAGDAQALNRGQISIDLKYALQERQKKVNKERQEQLLRAMSQGGEKMLALFKLTPFKSPRIKKVFPPSL